MSPIKTTRQECIVYSRVVGWYTPTSSWNNGKKAEFADRKTFDIKEGEI
ncbi:MAG: anaerobic ribonucleoside-triphosphate reductase [Patescibacteria group bacterium]